MISQWELGTQPSSPNPPDPSSPAHLGEQSYSSCGEIQLDQVTLVADGLLQTRGKHSIKVYQGKVAAIICSCYLEKEGRKSWTKPAVSEGFPTNSSFNISMELKGKNKEWLFSQKTNFIKVSHNRPVPEVDKGPAK